MQVVEFVVLQFTLQKQMMYQLMLFLFLKSKLSMTMTKSQCNPPSSLNLPGPDEVWFIRSKQTGLPCDAGERYRIRLDAVSASLSALEIEDLVTVRDVCIVAQRVEMVRRIAAE